jgi:asparagine synthase (glutamine-hydrolysing)
MCGIVGFISKEKASTRRYESLQNMTESLAHRGPDAKGFFQSPSGEVGVGHTRLSILDLTSNANQPFFSDNSRYVIVFNGEIFNFSALKQKLEREFGTTFRTTSDTEVILECYICYGHEMVHILEGMFAFAIYDTLTKKTFLCRDRLGKKPLYYFRNDSSIIFGSELKAILKFEDIASKVSINNVALQRTLHLGYIPEPLTIYNEIYKFPSGCFATVSSDLEFNVTSYWKPESFLLKSKVTDEILGKQKLHELLQQSVTDRLISDVPLGCFLSGGIDSSLVSAIAARLKGDGRLKTFNIGFKDHKFNESIYAKKIADHLNAEHYDFMLSETDALQYLELYIHHFDEPFYDTSAIPTMIVSKLARQHVKVALTGDGGDELFQGYGAYTWADRLSKIHWRLGRTAIKSLIDIFGQSEHKKVVHMIEDLPSDKGLESHIYSQEQGLFSETEIVRLLKKRNTYSEFHPNIPLSDHLLRPSEKQALFDLKYYLKDDLLVKVDRASMYYGLECRCPFLDHRVVEFGLQLAHTLKVKGSSTKWILRQILLDYFPSSFFDRPKRGFSIPLAQWMQGELRYLIDDYLNEKVIEEAGLVQTEVVRKLVERFKKGESYLYTRLWVLILVHKWILTFKN